MRWKAGIVLALLLCVARVGGAYQFIEFFNPENRKVKLRWGSDSMPVPFYFNNKTPQDITLDQAVVTAQTSFNTWESVETANISVTYAGTTSAEPFVFFDFINTLGFVSDPELEGTGILGATNWIVFTFTGEIAESDIFFNDFFNWSVDPNGKPGHFDFQSTCTHEIGHFLGLGHSDAGIMETNAFRRTVVEGSALMYPFAYPPGSTLGRTLEPDDIAGFSSLYPAPGFTNETGILAGRVTKNGQGLLGAHINAFNPFTGELIGFFTDAAGDYRMEGLKAGPYVVRVNPITDPTSPDNFDFPNQAVDTNFADEFFEGRAQVMPGETTTGIDLEVQQ